jgi:hypothetical protein
MRIHELSNFDEHQNHMEDLVITQLPGLHSEFLILWVWGVIEGLHIQEKFPGCWDEARSLP